MTHNMRLTHKHIIKVNCGFCYCYDDEFKTLTKLSKHDLANFLAASLPSNASNVETLL